jgi:thiamine transport system substrate-binding protein
MLKNKLFMMLALLSSLALVLSACQPAATASASPGSTPTGGVTESPQLSASSSPSAATPSGQRVLRIMTHDSFAASDNVIKAFEQADNVKLEFLKSGDAGTATNKAILSKNNPIADVFYGVDNTFLSRALQAGIFEPYNSPLLADIPAQYQLDPTHQALPVDWGDVCLNYDKAYFKDKGLTPPQTLDDLLKPAYKSLLVVENPASSSPGLAFLLVTIGDYGESGYLNYWKGLVANNVKIDDSWDTAYNVDFSGSAGHGPRPIVVSYGSSPPFEVLDAAKPISEPPTAAIVTDNTCFRQIEFVGILKGTNNLDLAEKWIDYMLSPTFQEDMPLQMYVFPVNPQAKLPEVFTKYMQVPAKTVSISPEEIAAKRDQWIQAWTQTILH